MSEDTSSESSQEPGDEPVPVAGTAREVSRRVGAILDAVEEEAARLREDAREQARLYLEEAHRQADELVAQRRERIAELSDELIAKSEAVVGRLEDAAPVRQSFENLVRALGGAADRLAEEVERAAPTPEPPPFEAEQIAVPTSGTEATAAPRSEPPDSPPAAEEDEGTHERAPSRPDSVRTIAIQMAGAGWTRHDVGKHLQQTLGVSDPEPVLGEIFGANSPDDARVPWTAYPR